LSLVPIAYPAAAGILSSVVNSSSPAYGLQPRPTGLSVCFYGDATTVRAARVAQIRDALVGNTQAAANIVFTGFGACAAPTTGTCGSPPHSCKQYPGDIRIALDGTTASGSVVTRQIPASYSDCADHGAPSSWAVSPNVVDNPGYRACPYNAAVGDDADTSQTPPVPWLNHPLHEVGGHSLGFAHEFLQAGYYNFAGPTGTVCSNSTSPPDAALHPGSYVSLTPADASSVMMYQVLDCGINGNYGFSGYSTWDQLSLHIMYPEADRVAEFFGGTVTTLNVPVKLTQLWIAKGANANVLNSISWSIGGMSSNQPTFSASWSTPGSKTGTLTYTDFLGRVFTTSITVQVYADSAALAGAVVVPSAASLAVQ
jgi:hypothetical protein